MDFLILGPVAVRGDGGGELPVGSARERLVLATLLLNADRLTSADRLVDALWEDPPPTAMAQLHNLISKLRRRLGAEGLIVTRPPGYELRLNGHGLDLRRFRELVDSGRAATEARDYRQAAELLARAASLWRGQALADVADSLVAGVRESLHDEKLAADELRLDAELRLGRHDSVLRELPALLEGHPYRERLHELRLTALAAAGRHAAALEAYQHVYRRFVADLGVEPGRALRDLEQLILRGEPPVPGAGRVRPRELPPATELTGRDELARVVSDALRSGAGPVVLVGPGGVGKTALAVGCAHGLAGAFPGGQLYADLRGAGDHPADPQVILARFLRALGVDSLPEEPDERIALYRSMIAERRILVVLDDAAGEEQVRDLLPGSQSCAVLVTSRRQLGGLVGATRWTVPVLPAADAVELIARIAGPDRVTAEPDAAARIVAACGCLPLATCIAAARLAVRPDWTLEELGRRLAEERGRLDELAVGDLDVRASIALSYHALEPATARLLRLLGLVTAPDWPAWVPDALLGAEAGRLLDQLTDVHLVEPLGGDSLGQSRFRLHDLVAAFAREQGAEDSLVERETAVCRLLHGWLALAAVADEAIPHGLIPTSTLDTYPSPPAAAEVARERPDDWFEAERRSVLAAVEEACRLGWPDLAGGLVLRSSGFLWLRSYDDDWELIVHQALAAARAHGSSDLLAHLLGVLFESRGQRDRYDELPGIAEEQLATARRLGNRELEIGALRHAGQAAVRLSRLDDALTWLNEALSLARRPGIPGRLLHDCLLTTAWATRQSGAAAHALRLLDEALGTATELGESIRAGLSDYHYGIILLDLGRLAEAERSFATATTIARKLRDELGIAYLDQAQADVDIRRRRFSRAATRLANAREIHDRIGSADGLAEALRSTGDLAAAQSQWAEAASWYQQSLTVWRRINARLEAARTLARLARAQQPLDPQAAATQAEYEAILAELNLGQDCLCLPPLPSRKPGQQE